jgi:hypothetical protein
MAKKKAAAAAPVIEAPPAPAGVKDVDEAIAAANALIDRWSATGPPVAEVSGADSTQGGADVPEQGVVAAAPEINAPPDLVIDAVALSDVDIAALAMRPGEIIVVPPTIQPSDLRAIRSTIDTLVFGCDSQRGR